MSAHISASFCGGSFDLPTPGAGPLAEAFDAFFRQHAEEGERRWLTIAPPTSSPHEATEENPMAERLYDSLAAAKTMTSRVAMHMNHELRVRLFSKLDALLDEENWYEEDPPVKSESFATFLRFLLFMNPSRLPGLGASDDGDLVVGWDVGPDRLTLIFMPDDTVRFVSSCMVDEEREYVSGHVPVARMRGDS